MRTQEEISAMHCPVCRVPLAMSDRQGIEIDYCPQCRGVWLDRGELDKIVERSAAPVPASRSEPRHQRHEPDHDQRYERAWGSEQAGYGQGHHGGHHGHHRKRKSWLEEIFD